LWFTIHDSSLVIRYSLFLTGHSWFLLHHSWFMGKCDFHIEFDENKLIWNQSKLPKFEESLTKQRYENERIVNWEVSTVNCSLLIAICWSRVGSAPLTTDIWER
jgi:hypothetical protein